ncbi:MAG: beta-galactosidase, partial [Planctomycetota bacterium]
MERSRLLGPACVLLMGTLLWSAAGAAQGPPRWIEPTDEVTSDHIAWEKNAAAGPLRVLFITHRRGLREVVEISQRLDVAREVAAVDRWDAFATNVTGMHAKVWHHTDEASTEAIFREKLAKKYDCIVVADVRWKTLPDWVRREILRKVESGAGLVLRIRGLPDEELKAALEGNPVSLPALSAFPFQGLPAFSSAKDFAEVAGRHLAFAEYGKGRVVRLLRLPSVPEEEKFDGFQVLTPECTERFPEFYPLHYEYYLALVGELLDWASGRRPKAMVLPGEGALALSRENMRSIDFRVQADSLLGTETEFVLRESRYGDVRAGAKRFLTLKRGENVVSFALGKVPAGEYFADLWIRQAGRTVDYGSLFVRVKSGASLENLDLAQEGFRLEEPTQGTVEVKNPGEGDRLVIEQVDNYGRVVAREVSDAAAGKVSFELRPASKISVLQTVEARLEGKEGAIDIRRRRFAYRDLFPSRKEFQFILWQSYTTAGDSYLNPLLAKVVHDAGFDIWQFIPAAYDRRLLFTGAGLLANLWSAPTVYGRGMTFRSPIFVECRLQQPSREAALGAARVPCLTDPEYLKAAQAVYRDLGKFFASLPVGYFNLGDECMFAHHNGKEDLCFSETCVADFREFVRREYGSIEKLNAEYGTAYGSFDEVVPVGLPAVRADRSLIPAWIDHRRHMNALWAGYLDHAREWLLSEAPGARVGYEGSGDTGHGPRNGALTATDYWKLAHAMDVNGMYYWPYQLDAVRDFSPEGALIGGGWFGGYHAIWRAGHDPLTHVWWLSNAILRGANSAWVFTGLGYDSMSVIAPDFSFYDYFRETLKAVKVIREGLGRLVMEHRRADDGVAVLYSPASMLLASLEDEENGFWDSA